MDQNEEVVFSSSAANYDKVVEAWGLESGDDSDQDEDVNALNLERKTTGIGATASSTPKPDVERSTKVTNNIKEKLKRQRELEKKQAADWKHDDDGSDDDMKDLSKGGNKRKRQKQPLANRIHSFVHNDTPSKATPAKKNKKKKKKELKKSSSTKKRSVDDAELQGEDLIGKPVHKKEKVESSSAADDKAKGDSEREADSTAITQPTETTKSAAAAEIPRKKKNKRPKKRSKQKNIRKDNRPPELRPTFAQTGRGIGKKHRKKWEQKQVDQNQK